MKVCNFHNKITKHDSEKKTALITLKQDSNYCTSTHKCKRIRKTKWMRKSNSGEGTEGIQLCHSFPEFQFWENQIRRTELSLKLNSIIAKDGSTRRQKLSGSSCFSVVHVYLCVVFSWNGFVVFMCRNVSSLQKLTTRPKFSKFVVTPDSLKRGAW